MVVVAAVDRSGRSSHVVAEAASLAAAFDEPVHVVHALTRSEFVDLGLTSAQAEEPKDMAEIRSAAAEMAEDAVPELSVPYETVGLVGNPAEEVTEYADEQDASYIVVSPRRRSRTGKMLFGSVAQSILLNASCPVVSTLAAEE
ncbi:universal stress protein [Haloferax sp. Atlit-12N]|uniref:universal stress protein n=1 Tax=Haloferax sp. Atlit-12N TaxID=2077203 RepID=UPI000E242797|nr:universal stress protein [Haloferax sp. Atlit-12N]RDZ65656.1 universal stress protein [Haloferax sp. Atlit-12N]